MFIINKYNIISLGKNYSYMFKKKKYLFLK